MALFRLGPPQEPSHFIQGDGVYLRPPTAADFTAWAQLRGQSREFLVPWEPVWPADDLTRAAYRRRLKRQEEEILRDETYPFFVFRTQDHALAGGITLGHIRRGVAQTGTLGYWAGQPFAGKGYMSKGVRALCRFAFGTLGLHRVEAACLLHNEASARLLQRCGFKYEGQARAYLRINGLWQDHQLFALLDSDEIPAPGAPV